jgi:membrane protein implicated in regulation of membrane protease activity
MTGIGGVAGNVGGGLVLTAGSWRWLFAAAAALSLGLAALVARARRCRHATTARSARWPPCC